MNNIGSTVMHAISVFAVMLGWGDPPGARAQGSEHVVISEVYGGGGNAGSVLRNDFIELYNPESVAVSMDHWSLQYSTAAGVFTSGNRTVFSGDIAAHGFFLIREAKGTGGTVDLPAPDDTGTVNLAASGGKVALVSDSFLIAGPSGSSVQDFLGYGSANQFEGAAPAPALSNTSSAERKAQSSSTATSMRDGGADSLSGNGFDSGSNADDFVIRPYPGPQNSASPSEDPPSGPPPPPPQADHLVISEVYGGGGNSGARYANDFIELYNPTADTVSVNGWSVQYANGSGSFTPGNRTVLAGAVPGYGFFLIEEAAGLGGSEVLPAPDVTDSVRMAASSGKVALVSDTAMITGPSGAAVVDFVGYGSANEFEGGGPAASLSNTTSAERKARSSSTSVSMTGGGPDSLSGNGFDSGDNSADFIVRPRQDPQNSLSLPENPSGLVSAQLLLSPRIGWNMISVSLGLSDRRAAVLFPSAISMAFAYRGSYVVDDTIRSGVGYWLKFPPDAGVAITGLLPAGDTMTLAGGWNMIGAPGVPATPAGILQSPDGIVTSRFFGYNGSYIVADTLFPGQAYWVKSSGPGLLIYRQR